MFQTGPLRKEAALKSIILANLNQCSSLRLVRYCCSISEITLNVENVPCISQPSCKHCLSCPNTKPNFPHSVCIFGSSVDLKRRLLDLFLPHFTDHSAATFFACAFYKYLSSFCLVTSNLQLSVLISGSPE